MAQQFILNVAERAQTGRSASRRLRKANRVPAILYGKHTKPESLSIEGPEFVKLLKSVGDRAVLIELQRNGNKALSFLQEVQRDPITDKYLHVDLQEVKADEKFEIRVPVHLWYGGLDASPLHSPDHGASLARRIPGAARTLVEGAGGAILWTHGAEILAALLEARRRAGN